MEKPRQERGRLTPRTLQTIQADHARYLAAGGNLKNAKLFNNAIDSHFLDIELDKV